MQQQLSRTTKNNNNNKEQIKILIFNIYFNINTNFIVALKKKLIVPNAKYTLGYKHYTPQGCIKNFGFLVWAYDF